MSVATFTQAFKGRSTPDLQRILADATKRAGRTDLSAKAEQNTYDMIEAASNILLQRGASLDAPAPSAPMTDNQKVLLIAAAVAVVFFSAQAG